MLYIVVVMRYYDPYCCWLQSHIMILELRYENTRCQYSKKELPYMSDHESLYEKHHTYANPNVNQPSRKVKR